MVSYYTNEPCWEIEKSAGTAEKWDSAFQASAEVKGLAKQIAADPARYHVSQYLGHSCLVVVQEAHPFEEDRSLASLRDVLGIALGPGASVYVEQHRIWKGTPDNWKADAFASYRGDCTQFVREPIGLVRELYLSDPTDRRAEDREVPDMYEGGLAPYRKLHDTIKDVIAIEASGATSYRHDRYFTGPEAVELAGQLMPVGHQFSHPALQEWYAERIATAQLSA